MLAIKTQENRLSIQSGGTTLAAVLTLASPTAPLIVLAHGFAGNKNEHGLFTEATEYLVGSGFSVLRFDFRACGENKGTFKHVRLHDLVSDLRSVFIYIKSDRSLRPLPIGFVGFSLGAGIGLLAGLPFETYVFWSPAIYTRTDMVPRYQSEVNQKGYVIKGNIEVSKQFIADLDSYAIPNSLALVTAPVLLIHGSADHRIPHGSSKAALRSLRRTSPDSEMVVISGADHSFRISRARERLFSASSAWLTKHLHESSGNPQQIENLEKWQVGHPGAAFHRPTGGTQPHL